jgi:hypothetical protein
MGPAFCIHRETETRISSAPNADFQEHPSAAMAWLLIFISGIVQRSKSMSVARLSLGDKIPNGQVSELHPVGIAG